MITLEVLSDACRTSPLSINTSSIVSMAPVRQNIEEVNGRSASDLSFTEIAYSVGSSVERVIVIGEYRSLVRKVGKTKGLLYG